MSQPFVGQIACVGFNFAPVGWHLCDGSLLSISENETLFTLIGTTYGGDGQSTFAVPDLRGRAPLHMGQGSGLSNYVIGETLGVTDVTVNVQQMPAHGHPVLTTAQPATSNAPASNTIFGNEGAGASQLPAFQPFVQASAVGMNPGSVGPAGGSQPHSNQQPYLVLNYIISLFGIFPSQN